ncbi:MAG: right-handed parallel beta-helix repeat-containing protein [Woeseiaceae bacterium]|nr:right-handed parallel beta-helix repeat-containing protein [Woeseiaceae bacterium]
MPRQGRFSNRAAVLLLTALPSLSHAADIEIFEGDSFESAVENLNPGDTLTVHAGTYSDTGRISIGVKGTAAMPVVIQAAPGARPLITRLGGSVQNTINIEGAEYLTIRGFEITGNGGDGINMSGNPSYITLEDLVIHDISVGVNFRSSMHNITVRGNHIYNTNDTGEGMYVGCNYATCVVRDSLIENNWIHDTLNADQGDGIEIKRGSHSNVIRNNVIHDTNWPCVLTYGTEGNPRNIVEGNVMWNCGESGMQIAADTVIRNNIILDGPGYAFVSQPHQGVNPANLEIVHNTFMGDNGCLRLNDWNNKPGIVFANNAVYCNSANYSIGGVNGAAISGNVMLPAPPSFPSSGYAAGRNRSADFIDVDNRDVYPSADSPLIGAGDATYVEPEDFNGTSRMGAADTGAYLWSGPTNPGWAVVPGFKAGTTPGPTLDFSASPTEVAYQGQSTLTWTTSGATECTASGAWTGARPTSGQEVVGPLTNDSDFELRCANASNVTISDSLTVSVMDAPANAPTLSLAANPTVVSPNSASEISWTATDADSCMADGAWSGARSTSGNEMTSALTTTSTYSLECSGPGGTVNRQVVVTVQAADGGNGDNGGSEDTGGGALSWLLLLLLAGYRLRLRST